MTMAIMHVRIIFDKSCISEKSNDLTIDAEILIIYIRVPKLRRNL